MPDIRVQRPAIGVGVLVWRGKQLLLGKRTMKGQQACWQFPGGHLEAGESVIECAMREVLDETGVTIRLPRHLDYTDRLFDVGQRSRGDTKWSTMSRLGLGITAITAFTSAPLHLMTLVGLLSFVFALLLGLQTLYMWVNGQAVEGFTTVIMLLLFFGSMITLGLGIIGAYLSKIHDEVRGRPRYIVDEVLAGTDAGRISG